MSIKRLDQMSLIAFDFDGVFTDNKVICDSDGIEYVMCSRSDSYGISLLHKEIERRNLQIRTMVVTTESNSVVSKRCKKMGITCYDNIADKRNFMESQIQSLTSAGIHGDILFAGNDLNDMQAMLLSDFSFAPSDAQIQIKQIATHLLASAGGAGFVREVVEWLLMEQDSINA